ncbi:MAG TPA: hypothetical protein VMG59_02485 [Phycisphaerae bacterium]|nr:hypothetical protein [Phycisphaerae bacterium]
MYKNYNKLRVIIVVVLSQMLCLILMIIPSSAKTLFESANNSTMNFQEPVILSAFDGINVTIQPDPKILAVTIVTKNKGKDTVMIFDEPSLAATGLLMFDSVGNLLPYTEEEDQRQAFPNRQTLYLAPGKSLTQVFALNQYYQFNNKGVFYVFYSQYVIVGAGKRVGSPILQLILNGEMRPNWKVVPAVPQPPPSMSPQLENQMQEHSYPKYKIPTDGPIATLTQISAAVQAGDLEQVKQLCYQANTDPPPLFVAEAEEAIAMSKLCVALQSKFSVNPEQNIARTHPSPEEFSHFLAELNPNSMKINDDIASVGIFYYQEGKFVPSNSFAFHFRNVNGEWLLDSWATFKSQLNVSQYNLNVENDLKEAQMFNSLTQDLENNRFTNLQDFNAVADQQMIAIDRWFMAQSLKGSVKPIGSAATNVGPVLSRPITFLGTSLVIKPDPNQPIVTVTMTNDGNQPVTLWSGMMGWNLVVIGLNGRPPLPTQDRYLISQSKSFMEPTKGQAPLTPGMSISKEFDIGHYWVIYPNGTYYVFVRRFVSMGRMGGPVESPVLKLTLHTGKRPEWEVVPRSAIPEPKPLLPNNNSSTTVPATQN